VVTVALPLLIAMADVPVEPPPVVLSAEHVRALLASLSKERAGSNKLLAERQNYRLSVARVVDRDGPAEVHDDTADVFVVLSGSGKLMLGGSLLDARQVRSGERQAAGLSGAREILLKSGTIVEVPCGIAHQVLARGTEVHYLVIKVERRGLAGTR
jgi:mannose-6-phosphate isomerase-like protein (cupin superfamily)